MYYWMAKMYYSSSNQVEVHLLTLSITLSPLVHAYRYLLTKVTAVHLTFLTFDGCMALSLL